MRNHFFLALLVLAGGCMTTNGAVGANALTLSVAPESPTPGAEVTLILRNRSEEMIGYNLCTSSLMRQVGDAWEPVPSDRVCTMELRTLEPGDEATFPLEMEADVPAGTYRFETRIEWLERQTGDRVATSPFTITA
jgi:hypothetical protein